MNDPSLIVFCLSVYFLFHVLSRSDLLNRPREWAYKTLPSWVTYVLGCAFCFTWWAALFASFIGAIPWAATYLFAAPVVNLLVDQVLQMLLRANTTVFLVSSSEAVTGVNSASATFTWNPPAEPTITAVADATPPTSP